MFQNLILQRSVGSSFGLPIALEGDEILETVKRMIRRIPVVNAQGGLEGIIAVDDLVDFLAEQMADLVALILTEQRQEQKNRT